VQAIAWAPPAPSRAPSAWSSCLRARARSSRARRRDRHLPDRQPGYGERRTGDVLAGVIGALLAQGLAAYDAAALGVFAHGAAGDAVAARQGEVGLLASDLLAELPATLERLQAAARPRRRAGEATVRARETTTRDPEETEALGEALGRAARGGELIGLVGELGAGKTCLVRGLARGLASTPSASTAPRSRS